MTPEEKAEAAPEEDTGSADKSEQSGSGNVDKTEISGEPVEDIKKPVKKDKKNDDGTGHLKKETTGSGSDDKQRSSTDKIPAENGGSEIDKDETDGTVEAGDGVVPEPDIDKTDSADIDPEVKIEEPAKTEDTTASNTPDDSPSEDKSDGDGSKDVPVEVKDKPEGKKGDAKKRSGKGKKGEKKPKIQDIEFPPMKEDPSIYVVADLEILSRKETVNRLIKKHVDFIEKFSLELQGDLVATPEEIAEMEQQKVERDRLNAKVAVLKDQRSKYRSMNKDLSKQFIEMIEMQEHVEAKKSDITIHTRFWKDLEWKLETEAIDSDTERRLMDDIRSTVDQIRSITDGYTPEEVKSKLTMIDKDIKENLEKIESYHHQMLDIVNESQKHHERYLEISKKTKEMEGRKGWLTRRIALHEEMKKFWEGQVGNAEKLDTEEGKRTIEMIRDGLLGGVEEKDPPKKGKDRRSKNQQNSTKSGGRSEKKQGKKVSSDRKAKEDAKAPKKSDKKPTEENINKADAGKEPKAEKEEVVSNSHDSVKEKIEEEPQAKPEPEKRADEPIEKAEGPEVVE